MLPSTFFKGLKFCGSIVASGMRNKYRSFSFMHNVEYITGLKVPKYNHSDKIYFFASYHIAGTKGVFYAREPYSNVDAVHVTRFLGLASVGNKEKQVLYGLGSSQ